MATAPATRTVHVGRQRLRVSIERPGAGRPVLLVNGIGATGDLFETFRGCLGERETIAFDAPGVGGSPAPRYPLTLRCLSDIVAGLVDEVGHDRVDVLGLSWGGTLSQELAHRHPERVRRLVLTATTPGVVSVPGRPSAVAILLSPARYYSPEYLRRVAPTLYGGCIVHHLDVLQRHAYLRSTRPPSQRGYLYQLMALRRWSSLPWLAQLPHPTLVLAGDDDPIIPLVNARVMASRLADGRLEVIDAGGHLFLFTHPEETGATIVDFLDEEPWPV